MHAQLSNPYQMSSVATAGPAQLTLMLYDRALVGLARAQQADGPQRVEVVNSELTRVQDIVTELLVTLDRERGGDIARNLAALYDYCLDRLIRANVRKDLGLLDEVRAVLTPLRDAWEQACCSAPVPAG